MCNSFLEQDFRAAPVRLIRFLIIAGMGLLVSAVHATPMNADSSSGSSSGSELSIDSLCAGSVCVEHMSAGSAARIATVDTNLAPPPGPIPFDVSEAGSANLDTTKSWRYWRYIRDCRSSHSTTNLSRYSYSCADKTKSVPEPGTLLIMGTALLLLAFVRSRRETGGRSTG